MQVLGAGGAGAEPCLVHRLAPTLKLPLQGPPSPTQGLGVLVNHVAHCPEDTKLDHWWSLVLSSILLGTWPLGQEEG